MGRSDIKCIRVLQILARNAHNLKSCRFFVSWLCQNDQLLDLTKGEVNMNLIRSAHHDAIQY